MSGWGKLGHSHFMWTRDVIIGLVGPIASFWLLAILVKRKLYREFPFFFSYIGAVIAVTAIRLWVMPEYKTFFRVYWFSEIVYAMLALLALHEAFRCIFEEFYEIWGWFWLVFPTAVGVSAFVTIMASLGRAPAQVPPMVAFVRLADATVNWVQAALFGLICVLVWLVGTWEFYPVGIVTGFAALALGSWAALTSFSGFGTKFNAVGKYGPPLAYCIAVFVWLRTFIPPPRQEDWEAWSKTMTPEQMMAEVKGYLRILKGKRSKE